MIVHLCPGYGATCKVVFPPKIGFGANAKVHYHCNVEGYVRCFIGAPNDCPDFQKARTAHELFRGESR